MTPTPDQWPVVDGSSIWNVYRPTVDQLTGPDYNPYTNAKPVVVPLRVLQFDIIVKDTIASPQTGWVFITYVYDKDAPGSTTWDKLVPLGAMWGNDPAFRPQSQRDRSERRPACRKHGSIRRRRLTPLHPSAGVAGCRDRSTSRSATMWC